MIPHHLLNRFDNVGVSAAAANIAAHELADFLRGFRPTLRDQSCRRADLPRRAVAALERIMVDERLLQRMQRALGRETSIVVICAPSYMTANVRHELTRRPSMSTVQAPHWP